MKAAGSTPNHVLVHFFPFWVHKCLRIDKHVFSKYMDGALKKDAKHFVDSMVVIFLGETSVCLFFS